METDENSAGPNDQAVDAISRRDALKSFAAGLAMPLVPALTRGRGNAPEVEEEPEVLNQRDQSFDVGWRFFRGDAPGAELPEFNDALWRRLDLPHDWSVEDRPPLTESSGEGAIWGGTVVPFRTGPFDRYLSEGKRETGWFVGGTGWYRKRFSARALAADRHIEIVFDGVYMNSDVWLNGYHLGNHPYGYTPFAFDLTPHLHPRRENVLVVRVRNEGRYSRWYSGSGIYRHVWLSVTGDVRVPLWGLYVTTPEVGKDTASVNVNVRIENRGSAAQNVTVRVRILDPENSPAGNHEAMQAMAAGSSVQQDHSFVVKVPRLWSMATPQLYRAEVELAVGGTVDRTTTSFGIRKIEVDAERGLRINGDQVKLRGACVHHDNGLLGAAAIDRAEERRVELLKSYGFNAIRCSHNPPSHAFLEACDRLGMVVIDEAFDQWTIEKNPQDYHLYFKDWWQRDIDAMVLRDRNHPSVVFWSIGNEVPERADAAGAAIAKQIVDEIKRLDPTRPITAAIPFFFESGRARPWVESDPAFQYLNVGGYNYQWSVNGKEIGVKPVSAETKFKAEFEVPYAAGELRAVALARSSQIAELAFVTTGKPAKLRLSADRQSIRGNRNDLAYVTLEVLDEAGRATPDASVPVAFTINSPGVLAAAGTANPKDVRSFRRDTPRTFHGKCLAIIRPTGSAGSITVRAEAQGLESDQVVLKVG